MKPNPSKSSFFPQVSKQLLKLSIKFFRCPLLALSGGYVFITLTGSVKKKVQLPSFRPGVPLWLPFNLPLRAGISLSNFSRILLNLYAHFLFSSDDMVSRLKSSL